MLFDILKPIISLQLTLDSRIPLFLITAVVLKALRGIKIQAIPFTLRPIIFARLYMKFPDYYNQTLVNMTFRIKVHCTEMLMYSDFQVDRDQ